MYPHSQSPQTPAHHVSFKRKLTSGDRRKKNNKAALVAEDSPTTADTPPTPYSCTVSSQSRSGTVLPESPKCAKLVSVPRSPGPTTPTT
mmetsp:Transcript_22519/g.30471  ORF Transcript_22519/g.30471 Transcript_22519/m.30471 type:complete len:89 (-) Transcript_22519:131-397(-)